MWTHYLQAAAEVATALGVFFAGWQLLAAKRQSITEFEDSLGREYREIAQRLPVEALLGGSLDESELKEALDCFYHYIDLSNEQTFLRMNGRVTRETWRNWADGIRGNLSRPAFRAAWEEISRRATDSFSELRRLEASDFKADPRAWA